jgi:hypothetical protein
MLRVLGSVWSAQLVGLHQLAACASEAASLAAVRSVSTKRGRRSEFKVRLTQLMAAVASAMHAAAPVSFKFVNLASRPAHCTPCYLRSSLCHTSTCNVVGLHCAETCVLVPRKTGYSAGSMFRL